jgi:hypothetical protein
VCCSIGVRRRLRHAMLSPHPIYNVRSQDVTREQAHVRQPSKQPNGLWRTNFACVTRPTVISWLIPILQKLCHQLENLRRCRSRQECRPQSQLEHFTLAADGIRLPRWALTSHVAIGAIPAKSAVTAAFEVVDVHVVLPPPTPIALGPTERAHDAPSYASNPYVPSYVPKSLRLKGLRLLTPQILMP